MNALEEALNNIPSYDLTPYLTKSEAQQTYQPKGNYLTEHQDLSEYAKKSELPASIDAYTKAESDAKYQPKGDYLTEHQSLKTINGESLVGTGNITISAGGLSSFDIKIENNKLYKKSSADSD